MPSREGSQLKIIYFLFKDQTLLSVHACFYVLLFITYRIVAGFSYDVYRSYHETFDSFISIFLIATLSVEVILFFSMLIKLFTQPKTHQLTSFMGLFIGAFICFIWLAIVVYYHLITDDHWGWSIGLDFAVTTLLPCVISIGGFILLLFIKALRSGIYRLINQQNSQETK
ncbi:hypothetical protein A9G13_07640 [Gilliamella sp. wkB178]|uniref:hypothetical protein n=1 Tax=Gilliamella sp. wkB178 TaxID=3120259 RepID=UPI00080D9AA5|nr:hypothetical protein [Gilliamella apicola]OCG08060.1 hypothetical protein A9G13_07640 [Gilliamella apicola]